MKTVRLLRLLRLVPLVVALPGLASADPPEKDGDRGIGTEAPVNAPAPSLAAARPAAEPSPVAEPPPLAERPATTTTWYGWQTLLVDGGVIGASLATRNPWVFMGGYTLGGPIVHWAHGNVLKGFGSLGIRVVAPLLVGAVYSAASAANQNQPRTGHEGEETVSVAILAGGLAAIAFDAAFLARSEDTVDPAPPPRPSMLKVEPRVSASRGGAYAGIGGTF